MRNKIIPLILFALLLANAAQAQKRNCQLSIEVSTVEGDNLDGQPITLTYTDFQTGYGALKLNSEGVCTVKVYAGNHNLSIERPGFEPLSYDFNVGEEETEKTVSVTLTEQTRTPYALTANVVHDAMTGKDNIELAWNQEAPAFFDDFESYDGWAVQFGDWTGIDADLEAAAPLVGSYPNRGVMQYAQIINPLTVVPTWWYDYPILRPYGGQQYVGFTRTSSGNANDDWLITPVITVGTDNEFAFMAKAADRWPERFMVYVTTKTDNPTQQDFVRLDQGNYETADYTGWRRCSYDLSAYAGQQVKLAIRYISDYNRYGSFMLMVDDVYVGQKPLENRGYVGAKIRRCENSSQSERVGREGNLVPPYPRTSVPPKHSPANPNELFHIYLDGEEVGTTENYTYTIEDVPVGTHIVGIQASYKAALSEMVTMEVTIEKSNLSHVVFNVTANSILSPDGQTLRVLSLADGSQHDLVVSEGKAEIVSLPNGQYLVSMEEGAFEAYQQTVDVTEDASFDIVLEDNKIEPYNITATADEDGRYTMRWNQDLAFVESFEDYDDFASGQFGEWKTMDVDQLPVYPISLNGQIISFPGSGTPTNPMAIPPMVFNPWSTQPAMLPTDQAVAAPTGDKTVIFFSPQMGMADKWLISPLLTINKGYELSVKAKGYAAEYPESMEFCISDGSTAPGDFTVLSEASPLAAGEWALYTTDLSDYEGQQVRIGLHYTSYDAFFTQIDDFTVGPAEGSEAVIDYGNVVRFDIFVDGEKVGEATEAVFTLPPLTSGTHTIGIQAVYQNGSSTIGEYVISIDPTALPKVLCEAAHPLQHQVYDLQGRVIADSLSSLNKGIYIFKTSSPNSQHPTIRKVIR